MDIVIPEYIIKDRRVDFGAMVLYGILASLSPLEGYFRCSNDYLVELLGSSRSTVVKYLGQLRMHGYVKTFRRYRRDIEIVDKDFLKSLKKSCDSNE